MFRNQNLAPGCLLSRCREKQKFRTSQMKIRDVSAMTNIIAIIQVKIIFTSFHYGFISFNGITVNTYASMELLKSSIIFDKSTGPNLIPMK